MKKKFLIAVTAISLIVIAQLNSFAQMTEFTYQGKFTDGGSPAGGPYDFLFTLYDNETAGNATVTLLRPGVTVTGGIFTVRLDFGDAFPRFKFLHIQVKPSSGSTYTPLSPRQPLTSTPVSVRSLKSNEADNALLFGGEPPSSFVAEGDARLTDARPPTAGSPNYIQNGLGQQSGSFNVGGDGTVGGTLSGNLVSSATQFNLGGQRILGIDTGGGTFLGMFSGFSNTSSALGNTFMGNSAGFDNSTGSRNSLFGTNAGQTNNASHNSFFGYAAGLNSNGDLNSFYGAYTGQRNTFGVGNSFFGSGFFAGNPTGTVGTGAFNTTGNYNSFFGHRTGEANSTGSVNSFFGTGAGFANTSGDSNSFFGHDTGNSNTTGSYNSALGKNADVTVGDLKFATAIGAEALVGTSNTIVIGKAAGIYSNDPEPADRVHTPGNLTVNGNIGVGTTTPTQKLEVAGSGLFTQGVTIGSTGTFIASSPQAIIVVPASTSIAPQDCAPFIGAAPGASIGSPVAIGVTGSPGRGLVWTGSVVSGNVALNLCNITNSTITTTNTLTFAIRVFNF